MSIMIFIIGVGTGLGTAFLAMGIYDAKREKNRSLTVLANVEPDAEEAWKELQERVAEVVAMTVDELPQLDAWTA